MLGNLDLKGIYWSRVGDLYRRGHQNPTSNCLGTGLSAFLFGNGSFFSWGWSVERFLCFETALDSHSPVLAL